MTHSSSPLTAQCEICGITRPISELDIGYACVCANNPECRPPLTHPRQRKAATLTTEILDLYEWDADEADNYGQAAEVSSDALRALLDAVRRLHDVGKLLAYWEDGHDVRADNLRAVMDGTD